MLDHTRFDNLKDLDCAAALVIAICVFTIMNAFSVLAYDSKASGPNDIYRSVTKGQPYVVSGQKASFFRNGEKWSILGANMPSMEKYAEPKDWPVKGLRYEVLAVTDPINDDKILPKTRTLKNVVNSQRILVRACRGEYEPASFVIRTGDIKLEDVRIHATDLRSTNRGGSKRVETIGSRNLDIRVVKPWYQAGESRRTNKDGILVPEPEMLVKSKTLTPELLLHDDKFVQPNHLFQVNVVRDYKTTDDKEKVQSFDCEEQSNKQVWITLKVPENTKPGEYEGIITVKPRNAKETKLRLSLVVFPFELEAPKLYYTLYYLNTLQVSKNHGLPHFKKKSTVHKDFRDIRSHGINNVIISHRRLDFTILKEILDIKDSAGLDKTALFFTAWPKLATDYESLMRLRSDVEGVVRFARLRGIQKVYYYGVDELKSALLPLEKPMLKTIHDSGALTMTATDRSFFGIIDDMLDLVVFRGPPPQDVIEGVHKRNNKIWIYGNPQGGEEKPSVYRYNYGYLLWKLNVDGAAIYAYQCEMGEDPWDDFDHKKYRDHMLTYPTVNGNIPTIQWEGLREGIDDIRYLSTLLDLAQKSSKEHIVADFLTSLDFGQPPGLIRQLIIEKILSLTRN